MAKHMEEYFCFGGFPECATFQAKRDNLNSVYQKIFLGDIETRNGIENIFSLRVLLKKLAESIGQAISFSRAADIVASTGTKIGKSTVINYIEYAKGAFLLLTVPNIADNFTERTTSPKYYFIDNGLVSLLTLEARTSLLENLVAIQLMRLYGTKDKVFSYKRNIEVDFYLSDSEVAIQACYSLTASPITAEKELKTLEILGKQLPCKKKIIVSYEEEADIDVAGGKINVIPLWKFLLMSKEELSATVSSTKKLPED